MHDAFWPWCDVIHDAILPGIIRLKVDVIIEQCRRQFPLILGSGIQKNTFLACPTNA